MYAFLFQVKELRDLVHKWWEHWAWDEQAACSSIISNACVEPENIDKEEAELEGNTIDLSVDLRYKLLSMSPE